MDVDTELVHRNLAAPGLPVDDELAGPVQAAEDGVHAAAQGGGADGDLPVDLGIDQDALLILPKFWNVRQKSKRLLRKQTLKMATLTSS